MSEHPGLRKLCLHERLESNLPLVLHARGRSGQLEALAGVHRRRHVGTAAVVKAEMPSDTSHAVLQILQLSLSILEVVLFVTRELVFCKFRWLAEYDLRAKLGLVNHLHVVAEVGRVFASRHSTLLDGALNLRNILRRRGQLFEHEAAVLVDAIGLILLSLALLVKVRSGLVLTLTANRRLHYTISILDGCTVGLTPFIEFSTLSQQKTSSYLLHAALLLVEA